MHVVVAEFHAGLHDCGNDPAPWALRAVCQTGRCKLFFKTGEHFLQRFRFCYAEGVLFAASARRRHLAADDVDRRNGNSRAAAFSVFREASLRRLAEPDGPVCDFLCGKRDLTAQRHARVEMDLRKSCFCKFIGKCFSKVHGFCRVLLLPGDRTKMIAAENDSVRRKSQFRRT